MAVEHLEPGADSVESDCGVPMKLWPLISTVEPTLPLADLSTVMAGAGAGRPASRVQTVPLANSLLPSESATKFCRAHERAVHGLKYANFRRVAVGAVKSEGLEHRSILRVDRENTALRSGRVGKVGTPQFAVGSQEERSNGGSSCQRREWRKSHEAGADFKKVDVARYNPCNGFEGSIEIAVGALGQSTNAGIKQSRLELNREFTRQRELEDILIEREPLLPKILNNPATF
jgi:hypothetical protein